MDEFNEDNLRDISNNYIVSTRNKECYSVALKISS